MAEMVIPLASANDPDIYGFFRYRGIDLSLKRQVTC